ncbi:uncharacterized protein C8R40DRAFT_1235957 [Lentinula edodes]|uniref:uncharacterized protein n=1 Tax=Lentinula edodes TaxID=5353 RepID=UPI001E8D51CF|nr:uncharacterized protein C8R40DRAFT_1235957 [Lentinula edodes]KAH7877267.1 hypothetical protein C8R40DRAFT_1235957 [Lentinula edodes]
MTSPMESYANVYRWVHSPNVLLSCSPSSSSSSLSSLSADKSGSSICDNESELIPHGYRISRSPPLIVPSETNPRPRNLVEISASSSFTYQTNSSQDVLPTLNNSAASSNPSTASRNGFSSPDAISKPSSSAYSLAAHYGIPQALPRPPRTSPRTLVSQEKPLPDFESLSRNYLSMLANKPTDNTLSHAALINNTMSPVHVPAEMPAVSQIEDEEAALKAVVDTLIGTPIPISSCTSADSLDDWFAASPQFQKTGSFNEYLSSPFSTPYDDFNTSPMDDSPFAPDLSTPIMDAIDEEFGWSGMVGGMDEPIFTDAVSDLYDMLVVAEPAKQVAPVDSVAELLNSKHLYTIPPSTPALESVDSLYPSPRLPSVSAPAKPAPPPIPSSSRKVSYATGTRRNITPDALLPLDAPTQARRYVAPSSTSPKEVSTKKRSRSEAFADDDDEGHEDESKAPGPDATEKEKLEYKRRMSTIAARKSRRRKLEHKLMLEAKVEALEKDTEKWKTRCKVLQEVLRSHAVDFRFEDDE